MLREAQILCWLFLYQGVLQRGDDSQRLRGFFPQGKGRLYNQGQEERPQVSETRAGSDGARELVLSWCSVHLLRWAPTCPSQSKLDVFLQYSVSEWVRRSTEGVVVVCWDTSVTRGKWEVQVLDSQRAWAKRDSIFTGTCECGLWSGL